MLGLAQHHAGIGRQGRKPGTGRRFPLPRFAGRMSPPLLCLVGLWQAFQQASIAAKRIGDILDFPDIPQAPQALTPSSEGTAPARSSGTASPSSPAGSPYSRAPRAAAKGEIGVFRLL